MSEHDRWLEGAAAYALGALDPGEKAAFEEHLAGCESCRKEVESFRAVTGGLAWSAPPVPAPPGLRRRVLEAAEAAGRDSPGAAGGAGAGGPAHRVPSRPAAVRTARWLAAAAAVLWLVTGAAFLGERRSRLALQGVVEAREMEILALEDRVAAGDSILGAVLGENVSTATLVSTPDQPLLRLFWDRDRSLLVVAAHRLPPAPDGRVYQLWGIEDGRDPVSLGTFNTDASGSTRFLASMPSGVVPALGAVTREPAGGSPGPTETPFLVGAFTRGEQEG